MQPARRMLRACNCTATCATTAPPRPGAHSVDALLKHLAQRQKESPDYYERLPPMDFYNIYYIKVRACSNEEKEKKSILA